jgi:hypothetical protein
MNLSQDAWWNHPPKDLRKGLLIAGVDRKNHKTFRIDERFQQMSMLSDRI